MIRDLALGARMAVAGGRGGVVRAAMTAVGVALGVALLLVAASIPAIIPARHVRAEARDFVYIGAPHLNASANTMLVAQANTAYRGTQIRGLLMRPEGARAPVPPGVRALPGPGEMVVSPALGHLLSTKDGALLRPRLPYRITGTIGAPGLSGPGDYAYYAGSDRLVQGTQVTRIDHFGDASTQPGLDPILLLLTTIVFVVLLLPVGVFTAAAVRFGGERRDRRLAAVRLVGADAATARRIAAGEALASAVLGTALGALFFLAARQLVPRVTLWDISVFATDLRPAPVLAALVAVAVPVAAVTVTLLALRRVVIEPLGVARQSAGARRHVWWRLLLPVLGAVLLAVGRGRTSVVAAGAMLVLTGVVALLPWLVEAAVRRLGRAAGGTVSWQLAVRRLQLDSAASARVVAGVAVAAAGTIGLQILFSGVQGGYVPAEVAPELRGGRTRAGHRCWWTSPAPARHAPSTSAPGSGRRAASCRPRPSPGTTGRTAPPSWSPTATRCACSPTSGSAPTATRTPSAAAPTVHSGRYRGGRVP